MKVYFTQDDFGQLTQVEQIKMDDLASVQEAFNELMGYYVGMTNRANQFRSEASAARDTARKKTEGLQIVREFLLMLLKSIQSYPACHKVLTGTSQAPAFWIDWNGPGRSIFKLGRALGISDDLNKIPVVAGCLQYEREHLKP